MNTERINEVSDKMTNNTMEAFRTHPGVAAVLGLGISWFLADRMFKRQSTTSDQMIEQLQEQVAQLQEKTQQYAGSKIADLKKGAKDTGEIIAQRSQSALEGVSSYMDEYPLVTGFLGLSAGLILGVLTSGVLRDNGLLEETRQAVQKKTKQILHDTRERAGHVVDAVGKAAREEAERQQFIPH